MNDNKEIVFETKGLGKYIVSYKENHPDKEENTNNEQKPEEIKEKKVNYLPYALGGGAILLLAGAGYMLIGRKNKY